MRLYLKYHKESIKMRFKDLSDIGGWLWWVFIKFCKTDLKMEQKDDKWSRNILIFLITSILIGFMINLLTD